MSALAEPRIVEVAVTTAAPARYHYRLPPHLAAKGQVGSRVLVRFGGKKITGVIVREGTLPPVDVAPIDISEVLDDEPSMSAELVELCLWIAEYYEAPPGEALRAALPAGSSVTARTVYRATENGRAVMDGQGGALPVKQRVLLAKIAESELSTVGLTAPARNVIEGLIASGLVELFDLRDEGTKLRRVSVARVRGDLLGARTGAKRAKKRLAVIDAMLAILDGNAHVEDEEPDSLEVRIDAVQMPPLVGGSDAGADTHAAVDGAAVANAVAAADSEQSDAGSGSGSGSLLGTEPELARATDTAPGLASDAVAAADSERDAAESDASRSGKGRGTGKGTLLGTGPELARATDTAPGLASDAVAATDSEQSDAGSGSGSSETDSANAADAGRSGKGRGTGKGTLLGTEPDLDARPTEKAPDVGLVAVADADALADPGAVAAADSELSNAGSGSGSGSADPDAGSAGGDPNALPGADPDPRATDSAQSTAGPNAAAQDAEADAIPRPTLSVTDSMIMRVVSVGESGVVAAPLQVTDSMVIRTDELVVEERDYRGDEVLLDEIEKRVTGARPHLRELVKQGVLEIVEREADLEAAPVGTEMAGGGPPELTGEQAHAVAEITRALHAGAAFKPFLLFGVTGSGKTEVYLRVIAQAIETGKTALVLVPEISLTPQLAARFRGRFGDQVAILHSGLTEQARLGEWSRLRRGEARIAVGARSAVFAPLERLGVIVVDEEHDGSFKQDEGVKYHGRDVALVRAQRAGAVCVLGSGTPSLESNALAEKGAYEKLVLTERPMARPMPAVEVIDLRTWQPDGDAFLSAPLRTAIGETLTAGDQIILFLNRRGFATFVVCVSCGHAFRCPNCSVSLTYHKYGERLACHYCNHTEGVPSTCPKCGGARVERKGLGTEKIAAAVAEAFPTARVARLDRDVASGSKIEAVLSRVARREVDVLVGTQMVTKGHDFPGVTLVGVLCADTGLNIPDFRASERTFQLLAQVAGRAGRGDKPGRVIIQTYRPGAPAVLAAAAHDYERFYAAEVEERRERHYPPHGRLIVIRVDGPDEHEVAGIAQRIAVMCDALVRTLPAVEGDGVLGPTPLVEILGPTPAPLARLRGRSRWQIWLRSADRQALRRVARQAQGLEKPSRVRISLDVDPNSAL